MPRPIACSRGSCCDDVNSLDIDPMHRQAKTEVRHFYTAQDLKLACICVAANDRHGFAVY